MGSFGAWLARGAQGSRMDPGLELAVDGSSSAYVAALVQGSSAWHSSLCVGDRITHVNGQPTREMGMDQLTDLLSGDEGSMVEIRVESRQASESNVASLCKPRRVNQRVVRLIRGSFARDDDPKSKLLVSVREAQHCAGKANLGILCYPTEHIIYTFSLALAGHKWEVHKRYSDFMVLHKTLCIQYGERKIDVIIGKATLPGKVFLNKSSSSLISKRKERLENYVRGLASHRAVLRSDIFRNFLQFPDALYSPNDEAFDDSFAEIDDDEHEEICHAHSSYQATPRDLDVSIGSGTGAQPATPNTALALGGEEGRVVGRDDIALEALHARVATLQSKNDAHIQRLAELGLVDSSLLQSRSKSAGTQSKGTTPTAAAKEVNMWGSRGAEAAGIEELQGQPLAHVGADAPSAPSQHAGGGFPTSPAVTKVADPETFRPTPPPPRGREHLDDEGPSPARVHDMQGPLRDGDAETDGVVVGDDDGAQVDDVNAGGEARRQEVLEGDAELREEMQKRIWDRSFGHLPTPPATPVRQQAM